MRCTSLGFVAILLSVMTPVAHAQESSVYTATHGSSCTNRSREGFNLWRCPGPGGYVAEYADEGNIAGTAIWISTRQRRSVTNINWRGASRVFGDELEWRMAAGRPSAAILRIWRTEASASGQEREVEELIIFKLVPTGACRVASVNARHANANGIAHRTSNDAANLPCVTEP